MSSQNWQFGWGPFVHGDRIFGYHLSMGTELVGDRLSRGTNQLGTMCLGPNVSQPYREGLYRLTVYSTGELTVTMLPLNGIY